MDEWQGLLERLAGAPRENGTPALHETATYLADTLRASGADVALVPFLAQPWAWRIAAVFAVLSALAYVWALYARRYWLAACIAFAGSIVLFVHFRLPFPFLGLLAPEVQHTVEASLRAAQPEQRIVFTAHYDTTTELLDHVQTAPLDLLHILTPFVTIGLAITLARAMKEGLGDSWRRALTAIAACVAILDGVAVFASVGAGGFVREKSPGALDDGASSALLVGLVQALRAAPPLDRTDVVVALFSSEEISTLGSWAYAGTREAELASLPTAVVNLEGTGASRHLAVLAAEPFGVRTYSPDMDLVEMLDEAYRARSGESLVVSPYHATTDARSFLARGVPALTLASYVPGEITRHLHSARDDRSRLEGAALDSTLAFLLDVVRRADGDGLPSLRAGG